MDRELVLHEHKKTGFTPASLKEYLMHRQSKILFDEPSHTYTVDGVKLKSGTEFIGTFFEEFDEERISEFIAKRDNTTKTKVKAKWQRSRDYGTKVHDEIENYYLKGSFLSTPDSKLGVDFFDRLLRMSDIELIAPELRLYDKELGLAGTADMVLFHKNGQISLLDWKTNKKISRKPYQGKQWLGEFRSLDDTKYNKYMLQMSLYGHMIERNVVEDGEVGLIRNLILVHIRPSQYGWWNTDYVKDTVKTMISKRL